MSDVNNQYDFFKEVNIDANGNLGVVVTGGGGGLPALTTDHVWLGNASNVAVEVNKNTLGTSVTADNGLTELTGNIELGGTLSKQTTINGGSNQFDLGTLGSELTKFTVNSIEGQFDYMSGLQGIKTSVNPGGDTKALFDSSGVKTLERGIYDKQYVTTITGTQDILFNLASNGFSEFVRLSYANDGLAITPTQVYIQKGSNFIETNTTETKMNFGSNSVEINSVGVEINTNDLKVTGTVDGRDIATDGTKLDTISTNADVTLDSISAGSNITISPAGVIASTGGGASPLTTKGDLYTYDTTDERLPVGTDGQALVANSSTTTGLEWKTLSIYGVKLNTPTETEWESERTSWASNNAVGALGSALKLPMAGYRFNSGGIGAVGSNGSYWSSTVNSTNSKRLTFDNGGSQININSRAFGFSVRLIVDGTFTQAEYNTDYSTKIIEHLGLTYGFVYNTSTHKIWLDRNLGATQVATGSTDTASYGDLYQWGRPFDGHQSRTSLTHSDTLGKPSTEYETGAWDGKFITTAAAPNDWLSVQDTSLLQNRDSMTNRTLTLEEPTVSDDITIFRTDVAIVMQEVIAFSTGTSPDTTYDIKYSTDRSAAGTSLVSSEQTTSVSTGDVATISNVNIPANSFVWLEVSAASGTDVYLSLDIRYTKV